MKTLVEQIHEEFETAQVKLINYQPQACAETLYNLGFVKSKSVETYSPAHEQERAYAEHYRLHYPNNRYITEKQVAAICTKYGLMLTTVDRFTGEVPMSQVAMISAFHVRKGDIEERYITHEGDVERVGLYDEQGLEIGSPFWYSRMRAGEKERLPKHDLSERIAPKGLWICAPLANIDTEGLTQVNHNLGEARRVDDPVVLQPVRGGFLILAAWGEEAKDENVVNNQMN